MNRLYALFGSDIYAILNDQREVVRVYDQLEWSSWCLDDDERRRVAETMVGEVRVSTVFLGLDHGFGRAPRWFETMVFGGPLDQEQERYSTWAEAEAGHAAMVARCFQAESA